MVKRSGVARGREGGAQRIFRVELIYMMVLVVKNPAANARHGLDGSLGQEDPLEKDMAPHSSTLAWRIPWTEEPGGLESMRSERVGHDLAAKQQ